MFFLLISGALQELDALCNQAELKSSFKECLHKQISQLRQKGEKNVRIARVHVINKKKYHLAST